MTDQELKKLDWFLEGSFFTVVPPPSPSDSGQDIVEYLNKNNLTIVSFDVVSNLKRQLDAKEREWEEEKEEMKQVIRKLRLKKDLYVGNQTRLVNCIRKTAELTGLLGFKESFGGEDSKCVFVGQGDLDRFYGHVKSVFERRSSSPPTPPDSHPSHSPSEAESTTSGSKWQGEDKRKVKKVRKAVISSDDDNEEDAIKLVMKPVKRKIDYELPPLQLSPTPGPSSFKKVSSIFSRPSKGGSSTKFRCDQCHGRCDTEEEYKEHRKIVHRILARSKEHELDEQPGFLAKKKSDQSEKVSMPNESASNLVMGRRRIIRGPWDDEDDEEDDSGKETLLINEFNLPKSITCTVCGDPMKDKAVLNFHTKKKHPWKINNKGGN